MNTTTKLMTAWELGEAGRHAEAADAYAQALARFQPRPGSEYDQACVDNLRERAQRHRSMILVQRKPGESA